MEFLDRTFYDNTLRQWGTAALAGLAVYTVLRFGSDAVRGRLTALAQRTRTDWDDLVVHTLGKTRRVVLLIVAIYATATVLTLPPRLREVVNSVTILALLFQGGVWLSAGLGAWLKRLTERELKTDRGAATTVSAMGFVAKLVVWSVIILVALDNLGVDITTLVAGLGVGGVAVALAIQSILGDLFASLSIVLDKPFVLGDFVIVDEYLGHVEHIGLKTTRVRSLWGEQLVFSNGDLLKSRLRNFGRMAQRRVVFEVGVTYQTRREKLALIPQLVREAVELQKGARFDRSHFKRFGASALEFETVYYVLSPDFNTYMDIQQAVNLRICERFEEEGIEFAYPTQTLYLQKAAG